MRIVFLLAFGLIAHSTWCQWSESGGWLGLEVNQSLRNNWAWSVQYENRWDADWTRHQRGILDASIENTLFSAVKVNLQYRYSEERNRTGGYIPKQRLAFRLSSEGDLGKGEWNARFMTAQGVGAKSHSTDMPWLEEGQSWRFRVGYQHARQGLWRWKMDLEQFPDFQQFPEHKTRFRWLITREINESLSACMGYIWSQEWNAIDPETLHIVKANLSWALDRPKKRKKSKTKIPVARVIPANPLNSVTPVAPPVCTSEAVYVSEVHSKGEPADWVVITNRSDDWCTLKGWRLTDSLAKPGMEFEAIALPPKAKWVGYEKGQGAFDFGIASDGEWIFLVHPNGQMQQIEVLPQRSDAAQSVDFLGKSKPSSGLEND
ncbi:MAG: DUF2490 domain-containing protein [Flavobacteriales bacterium]|nr:DUF2490 domain-containing protein [Flavobacteriales bacterium]